MNQIQETNWLKKRIGKSKQHQEKIWKVGVNNFIFSKKEKKLITLSGSGHKMIEFMSCSYLGLEDDSRIREAAKKSIDEHGITCAAARTRMGPKITHELDEKLHRIFGGPTITFPTVGLCHLAVLPLLGANELPSYQMNQRPHWVLDHTTHASVQILRGILEQFGLVTRINFQDISLLKQTIQQISASGQTPITLSDGVGSMGHLAPVKHIMDYVEKYNGYAYIDDAHGTSIMGPHGAGYVMHELNGVFSKRLILTSSLAKAFGSTGGAVSVYGIQDDEKIRKYSNPYIFGGPLAIPTIAAANASADIHLSEEIYVLQEKLKNLCLYFDTLAPTGTVNFGNPVPIRGLFVGSEEKAIAINKELMTKGFACTVAVYPTVPSGQAMIRIALSNSHTKKDIDNLIHQFSQSMKTVHGLTNIMGGSYES